jgi:hypothetical protein
MLWITVFNIKSNKKQFSRAQYYPQKMITYTKSYPQGMNN